MGKKRKSRLCVKKNRTKHARKKAMKASLVAKENNPVAKEEIVVGALPGTVHENFFLTVNAAGEQPVQTTSEASMGSLQMGDADTRPQLCRVKESSSPRSPTSAEEHLERFLVSPTSGILREVKTESSESVGENINQNYSFVMDSPSKQASLDSLQMEDADKGPQQLTVNKSPSLISAEEQLKRYLVFPISGILGKVQIKSSESDGENLNQSCSLLMDSPSKEREPLSSTPVPEEPVCSSTFKVAEMICVSDLAPIGDGSSPLVDTTSCNNSSPEESHFPLHESIFSDRLQDTPNLNNISQEELHLSPHEPYFFERVRVELTTKLPASWEANCTEDTLILRKNSSVDLRGRVQRSAFVSRDGTVELQMHFSSIRLDHQIWQELPDRATLNSESLPGFVTYVLKIVDEFRKYDVCLGIPEKNYHDVARQMPGTVPDNNIFAESRYRFTFRSESCDIILQVIKKYCPSCSKIRANIKARCRRSSVLNGNPHPKTKNSCLDAHQLRQKLMELVREKKNAMRRASGGKKSELKDKVPCGCND